MTRELPYPNQRYLTDTNRDDYREQRNELIKYDIFYFIRCFEKDRNTKYTDLGKPDEEYRNDPRPDRLFKEQKTGSFLAVEYADLRKSERDTQELAEELRKFGYSGGFPDPTPEELALRLSELIDEKKIKNQFIKYPDAEKICLFRNRWTITIYPELFYQCAQYLELPEDRGYDHCYVLLSTGSVLEIF